MIRCLRLWTGDDQNSYFEEGVIDLTAGPRGDWLSDKLAVASISFQETASGGAFAWHTAPVRQLVVTLSGTLDFQTRAGEHFLIHPGNVLLAEDTVGSSPPISPGAVPTWSFNQEPRCRFALASCSVPRPDRGAREEKTNRSIDLKEKSDARYCRYRTGRCPHWRGRHELHARGLPERTRTLAHHRDLRNS